MKDSSTYQWLVKQREKGLKEGRREGIKEGRAEGHLEGARTLLLQLGSERFQQPDPQTVARLEKIRSLTRLREIVGKVLNPKVRGWDDLLGKA